MYAYKSRKFDNVDCIIASELIAVPVFELPPKCLQLILPFVNNARFWKIDVKYRQRGSFQNENVKLDVYTWNVKAA